MVKENIKTKTESEIIDTLRSEGIVVLHNAYYGLEAIVEETKLLLQNEGNDEYKFGTAAQLNELGKIQSQYPRIYRFFNQDWMKEVSLGYTGPSHHYFQEIMASHDYRSDRGVERNGQLHYDRRWALKFFLYLSDVTKDSGAFYYVPGSHKQGEWYRKNEWSQGKAYKNIRNRLIEDFGYNINNFNLVPVEAKAGTLIIFDTDTYHMGGFTKNGNERLVLRMHCR